MPSVFRHVLPAPPTEPVVRVYQQIARELGPRRAPVFMTLSPVPDILAGTWALTREALVAGPASRVDRELVATAVSVANRCPFCVDAHTIMLHSAGAHALAETLARGEIPADPRLARLAEWAAGTRTGHTGGPP